MNDRIKFAWRFSRMKLLEAGAVIVAIICALLLVVCLFLLCPVFMFGVSIILTALLTPLIALFFLCRFAYFFIRGYLHKRNQEKASV